MKPTLLLYDEVISTNLVLAQKIADEAACDEWSVVCAEHQTRGRGQASNCWESERAKNLLFSILLKPENVLASEQFLISQMVALSLKDVLELFLQRKVCIKWPNDIYIDDKKIAGILIENTLLGSRINNSIVGIGLNVNQTVFKSDAPNPVSMKQLAGKDFDKQLILDAVLQRLAFYYTNPTLQNRKMITAQYKKSLYRNSGFFPFETNGNERFFAKIHDVLPSGELVLIREKDNVPMTFSFKEVRFCI